MNHFEKIESYLPASLQSLGGFVIAFAVIYGFVIFRYFLLVGGFYFYFWKKQKIDGLYSLLGKTSQIRNEIFWSLLTSVIFAVVGVAIGWLWQMGWTKFYLRFDEYPLWWMPLSFLLFSIAHEIYFYFSHRWMHQPRVYRRIHAIHHLSLEPSPWASFCFHPMEAVIESLILPILVCTIPIHPVVFITYLTVMTISAINNHLGIELMPRWPVSEHLISASHHADHHRYFKCNFGLYFTVLDRVFKTQRRKKYFSVQNGQTSDVTRSQKSKLKVSKQAVDHRKDRRR